MSLHTNRGRLTSDVVSQNLHPLEYGFDTKISEGIQFMKDNMTKSVQEQFALSLHEAQTSRSLLSTIIRRADCNSCDVRAAFTSDHQCVKLWSPGSELRAGKSVGRGVDETLDVRTSSRVQPRTPVKSTRDASSIPHSGQSNDSEHTHNTLASTCAAHLGAIRVARIPEATFAGAVTRRPGDEG
eukprot:44949-Prorocentrum_minimum.AAC.1